MKKMFRDYFKRYCPLIIVVIAIMLTIGAVRNDIGENAIKIEESNLANDAATFSSYMDNIVESRLEQLRQIAKTINDEFYKDSELTKECLKDYKEKFSSLTVLTADGTKEYGDHITLQLDREDMLEKFAQSSDKKAVVYTDSVKEESEEKVVVLAVPVESGEKVSGIVVGTLQLSVLDDVIDTWGYSKAGCAFLIDMSGTYITGGKKFEEMLGGKALGFFSYLANCNLSGKMKSLADVEEAVTSGKQISLNYSHSGSDYISVLCPSVYKNWCVGFVERSEDLRQNYISVSNQTRMLLIFCAVILVLWGWTTVILTHDRIKLKSMLERYDVLNQTEKALIFEFQFEPKQLHFWGDSLGMFGLEIKTMYGEEVYDIYEYIHEEDRTIRGRLRHFYDAEDSSMFSSEIRIRNSAGGYGWYRISGVLVRDQKYGINEKFVGKIEDVNEQVVEEKNLVERAENDLLTGVLNKKTMEEKVTECLKNISGNMCYIFFMIDLDNFKNVNDKLGHIFGDRAIVDTANRLSDIFKKNAFVGRLGGDEFAVCAAYDAFDEESLMNYIKKKAEKICEANCRTYVNGSISVSITSSVGIAVAREAGKDFETIYKMADSALYSSKNGGKNRYSIYQINK